MRISYEVDPSAKLVVMHCEDAPVTEWITSMCAVVAEARYRPGYAFLLDGCGLLTSPTADELREVARFIRSHARALEQSRWAIVARTPVALAMARISAVFFEEFGVEVGSFEDDASARAWLGAPGPSAPSRP